MIILNYPIEFTVRLDELADNTAGKIEALYQRGAMYKRVLHAIVSRTGIDGYTGIHIAVAARNGRTKIKGYVVDHINGDNGDNRASNLRVITQSENSKVARPRLIAPDYRAAWSFATDHYHRTYHVNAMIYLDERDLDIAHRLDRNYERGFTGIAGHATRIKTEGEQSLGAIVLAKSGQPRPQKQTVDHINQDDGDNRLSNLRWVSAVDNNTNRFGGEKKQSRYYGVHWHSGRCKWASSITSVDGSGRNKVRGLYWGDSEIQAAIAYNTYVVENRLNKPLNVIMDAA